MTMSVQCFPNVIHRPINISQYNKTSLSLRIKPCLAGRCGAARDKDENQIVLPGGLEHQLMPKHIAVIPDGNRRWAKQRGLPVLHGYRVGVQVLKQLALSCSKYGIKVVSAFLFSTENWARPKKEVEFLMSLTGRTIASLLKDLIEKENMRVSYIGNRRMLSKSLQKHIRELEELGKSNTGMHLVIAFNYSGQYDIVEASKKIATKVKDGIFGAEDVDPTLFEQHLETNVVPFPNPDLLIRTSGELRISNFMLWQLAYSEMYFTDKMFPDLDDTDLVQALIEFQRRQRRFGGHKY